MAKQIECGKFLVIECTAGELMDATGSSFCMCDSCGKAMLPMHDGVYVAVLNQWLCRECFDEWRQDARWYVDDARIERRNYEFYAPRLGVKCQ